MKDLAITDFETTGLDAFVHEAVEISVLRKTHTQLVTGDFEMSDIRTVRIMPDYPEYAFEKGYKGICAADINGFSVEKWNKERSTFPLMNWAGAMEALHDQFENAKWCGYNAQFDFFFWRCLNNRNVFAKPPKLGDYHLMDLSTYGHWLLVNGKIKKNTLDDVAAYFGLYRTGSQHSSWEDVFLTAQIYQRFHLAFGYLSNR